MLLLESLLHIPLLEKNPHICPMASVSATVQYLHARHPLKPLITTITTHSCSQVVALIPMSVDILIIIINNLK